MTNRKVIKLRKTETKRFKILKRLAFERGIENFCIEIK